MSFDFKKGDKLVAATMDCLEIFEVDRIGRNGEVYDTRWRRLNVEHFRHATDEEIRAGHRISPMTIVQGD